MRRHRNGVVVAVQLKGRPWPAVVGDMIEGVVVANQLQHPHADRLRNELWAVVGTPVVDSPKPGPAPVSKVA